MHCAPYRFSVFCVRMEVKRAYKFRFYPTVEQVKNLAQTFGCVRYVYNHFLQVRTDSWYNDKVSLNYVATSALLTKLKAQEDHAWLNEVSSVPVQQGLRHLQTSFQNFFAKRAGYPGFHRKHGKQTAEYTTSGFRFAEGKLWLAKHKAPLDIHWSRAIPKTAIPTTVTVTRDTSGRYFVSILCTDSVEALPPVDSKIGIDLGVNSFAALSDGRKINGPKSGAKHRTKLARAQRILARKQKGSKNRNKARQKVARVHARISDSRRDFLHKLSTQLIRENQTICLESLDVSAMTKSAVGTKERPGKQVKQKSGNNRAILDQGWSEFVGLLKYKADWYSREIVQVSRWYPSSKRCANCGHILQKLGRGVRTWDCPECGVRHDRDTNAAVNILAAGLAVSVCGEQVSPEDPASSGTARRSRKPQR